MFKIPIRFVSVKNNEIFEVNLDKRLSFDDNFKLLKELIKIDYKNFYIFDPIRKIFLRKDISLKIEYFN